MQLRRNPYIEVSSMSSKRRRPLTRTAYTQGLQAADMGRLSGWHRHRRWLVRNRSGKNGGGASPGHAQIQGGCGADNLRGAPG